MSRTTADLHHTEYFQPEDDYFAGYEDFLDDLAREFAAAAECARVADERVARRYDSFDELMEAADAEAERRCLCGVETGESFVLCAECAESFAADQNQESNHVS